MLVQWNTIQTKKNNLNLPDRFIRIISSFLTDRNLEVCYEGSWSTKVRMYAGTPQGSPLSPLIYLIYVNDLPEEISELNKLAQFADDTAEYNRSYTHAYALHKLQKGLNLLEVWCRRWRVKLNGEKLKLIFITRASEKNLTKTLGYFYLTR